MYSYMDKMARKQYGTYELFFQIPFRQGRWSRYSMQCYELATPDLREGGSVPWLICK